VLPLLPVWLKKLPATMSSLCAAAAGYAWSALGENIAAGQSTVEIVVDGWMKSDGHCANLMNANFREIGAACVAGNANTTYRTYWTQDFGTPR